jgi:hypothetical protein
MNDVQPASRPSRASPTSYKQRRAAGAVELTPAHTRLAEYMVFGTNHARAKRLGFRIDEPLTLEQASDVLGMRRRNARQIFRLPAFRSLLASLIADLRDGGKARAVRRMIALIDEPGAGLAADRAVQLKAAVATLGEEAKGVSVQVGIQTTIAVKPGWILDASDRDRPEPPVIEQESIQPRPEHESFKRYRAIEAAEAEQDRLRALEAEEARNPVFKPRAY